MTTDMKLLLLPGPTSAIVSVLGEPDIQDLSPSVAALGSPADIRRLSGVSTVTAAGGEARHCEYQNRGAKKKTY